MGLESIAPKPTTSRQRKEHKVYPYLLKKMFITEPDQVWYSYITYIRLAHGFVYLAVVNVFTGALKDYGIKISMDGKGRCLANVIV